MLPNCEESCAAQLDFRSRLNEKLVLSVFVKEQRGLQEMAEAHQTRVQRVVEEMVQSLERDHIRNMQVTDLSHTRMTLCLPISRPDRLLFCAAGTHVQMQRRLLRSSL